PVDHEHPVVGHEVDRVHRRGVGLPRGARDVARMGNAERSLEHLVLRGRARRERDEEDEEPGARPHRPRRQATQPAPGGGGGGRPGGGGGGSLRAPLSAYGCAGGAYDCAGGGGGGSASRATGTWLPLAYMHCV